MSEAVRIELAEACSNVEGVRVSPYFHQDIKPGNGLVRFGGLNRPNRLGGVVTWQVVIFLPKNIADAERWMDRYVPQVLDAMTQQRSLTGLRVEPQQLALDTGTVSVVVIEGTREEA